MSVTCGQGLFSPTELSFPLPSPSPQRCCCVHCEDWPRQPCWQQGGGGHPFPPPRHVHLLCVCPPRCPPVPSCREEQRLPGDCEEGLLPNGEREGESGARRRVRKRSKEEEGARRRGRRRERGEEEGERQIAVVKMSPLFVHREAPLRPTTTSSGVVI